MTDQQLIDLLKRGPITWNKWRQQHPEIRLNLSGADLSSATLKETSLRGPKATDLSEVDLNGADLSSADLSGTTLCRTDLSEANLRGANLSGTRLGGANLSGVDLREADLSEADLSGANLTFATLNRADLSRANLSDADLRGALFIHAILVQANLTCANLHSANFSKTNLSGATLVLADLSSATLSGANLSGADLSAAHLSEHDLSGMILTGATLIRANLSGTNLSGTDLSRANLTEANLSRACLIGTNLTQATLNRCRVDSIAAWKVKLEEATQLDVVIHLSDHLIVETDRLEVALFVALFLGNEPLRHILSSVTSTLVIIVGHFTPQGRFLLVGPLKCELRTRGYVPVVVDSKYPNSTMIEIIRALAPLALFMVVDLTDANNMPLEWAKIVPELRVPIQFTLEATEQEVPVSLERLQDSSWDLPVYRYWMYHTSTPLPDPESLLRPIREQIIDPAEQNVRASRDK